MSHLSSFPIVTVIFLSCFVVIGPMTGSGRDAAFLLGFGLPRPFIGWRNSAFSETPMVRWKNLKCSKKKLATKKGKSMEKRWESATQITG